MRSDTVLDYAVFELSPKHSRCELFVSSNEQTEKLTSGMIEQYVKHLRVLEVQASPVVQSSVRLEVEKNETGNNWFTKKTLERFVQFVNSPEPLERVNTFYSEMSQLEAARTLYSQRSEGSDSDASDDGAAADATKKELLRAIDLRLEAIKKDLTSSIAQASANGFDPHTVSELKQFADRFGAPHLNKACSKYISLCQRRPDLIIMKYSEKMAGVHKVSSSNLSSENSKSSFEKGKTAQKQNSELEQKIQQCPASTKRSEEEKNDESVDVSSTVKTSHHTRRLSVQDRINLFENKQKENSNSAGRPVVVTKATELRRLSSDITSSEKSVFRRCSDVSDLSIDLASEKKLDSTIESPFSTSLSGPYTPVLKDSKESAKKGDEEASKDTVKSSSTVTEKSLISGADVTFGVEPRSVTDSGNSSASQNQTDGYVDKLPIVMGDAKSRQRQDSYEFANNVSQSSIMFPSRHTKSPSAHREGGIDFKSSDQFEGNEEELPSHPQWTSFAGKGKKKEVVPSDKQPDFTNIQRTISQNPASAGIEQSLKPFNAGDGFDDDDKSSSVDQLHRTRLPKEIPGVNDELQMKANELEKLFAEHKLRVPGDQSSSSRRGKPNESQVPQPEPSHSRGAVDKSRKLYPGGDSGDFSKLMTPLVGRTVGDKDKGDVMRRNFSDLSLTDESKGKFYDKYMNKRDAKLREEWSSKKAEKETKLKSLQEALEQSRTEMNAKLSASSERQDPLSSTRHRAEKYRSFNSRSSMKKYQHPINSFQSEEEDFSDQKPPAKDKPATGQSIGNSASRSSQARKLLLNKSMSSITPRSGTSAPKPSGKVSNTSSGRRRPDKPLTQSVPNFSDLIKENTKPSSLAVKTTMRTQVRSSGRNKNTKEDITSDVKHEQLQRPRSLRKSSCGSIDFTDLSTLRSDDTMAPLRVERVQRTDGEDSDISENLKNEEYDKPDDEVEESLVNAVREEEAEEETPVFDGDDENPTLSEVYEKIGNSGEENCSFLRSSSQVEPGLITDLQANVPQTFDTVASLIDSPGESPPAWNSNLQHSFSYPHEHSDVDASADSPMGSPASWSSRMRKKWGTAQSPVSVANSSQFQSRKDLTKGFKRLLKFGKKSRGTETLMDSVSVTTSEADDEIEERRELADRSSDDLRKSRMGSLQSHLFEDGFNESEASNSSIPEQMSGNNIKAQKSFFSLSTFRGKGNESKPR